MIKVLEKNRQQILAIAQKHGATNLRVFGSMARGTADNKSDVDFLADRGINGAI